MAIASPFAVGGVTVTIPTSTAFVDTKRTPNATLHWLQRTNIWQTLWIIVSWQWQWHCSWQNYQMIQFLQFQIWSEYYAHSPVYIATIVDRHVCNTMFEARVCNNLSFQMFRSLNFHPINRFTFHFGKLSFLLCISDRTAFLNNFFLKKSYFAPAGGMKIFLKTKFQMITMN